MVGIKDIKMRLLDCVKCDFYKAEILIGNLGFAVIETLRDKRGPKKLWPVELVKTNCE